MDREDLFGVRVGWRYLGAGNNNSAAPWSYLNLAGGETRVLRDVAALRSSQRDAIIRVLSRPQGMHAALVPHVLPLVDETGREFYAVSTEFDPDKAIPWVRRNVLDQLPPPADKAWRSRERIRDDLLSFLTGPGEEIELWAWFAAYDHVALCQLWGAMPALPRPIPRFTRELRQEGKLGFWRWASILFGAAGTYRQNDVVDVIYERAGQRAVASALPVQP